MVKHTFLTAEELESADAPRLREEVRAYAILVADTAGVLQGYAGVNQLSTIRRLINNLTAHEIEVP